MREQKGHMNEDETLEMSQDRMNEPAYINCMSTKPSQ